MKNILNIPSPIIELNSTDFTDKKIQVFVKRDDKIHCEISGNKWRKLRLNVEKHKEGSFDALLTFGGAYSNHIAATAAAGKAFNIPTIGIIRGDELSSSSNETLNKASKNGMQLEFVARDEYRKRYDLEYHEELKRKYGNIYIVDEGGANYLGMLGCVDIMSELEAEPDYVITAAGTGTTAAGLLFGSKKTNIIAVPVLKNAGFIKNEVERLIRFSGIDELELKEKYMNRFQLELNYHFGGYGKYNDELIEFINTTYELHNLPLDQIYTGKMFFAFRQLLKQNIFKPGDKVLVLHTGGLQGLSTIAHKINFNYEN